MSDIVQYENILKFVDILNTIFNTPPLIVEKKCLIETETSSFKQLAFKWNISFELCPNLLPISLPDTD